MLSPVQPSAASLNGKRFMHPRIKQVIDAVRAAVYPGSQDNLIAICGPTGVGKTTLTRYLVEKQLEESVIEMDANPGMIPAIYVEAPASGEDEFSWRLFYQRILAQLGDDMDVPKSAYGVDQHTGRMVRPYGGRGGGLAALRSGVERALDEREVKFVVIDEAAHIIRQTSRRKLPIQLDTLKSLANGGTQMVMVGSYDLHQLMALSGQLTRRTHVIHFERYREDCPEDVNAFNAGLRSFQKVLPHLWGNDQLMPYAQALLSNTLGCIGTLSAVLSRAARLAEVDGKWSVHALERALLNETQHRQILSEILDGEAEIRPSLTREMPVIRRSTLRRDRSVA
ncbi:AAA domain-containing protein [Paraburkholderia lycopersici]|uniref:AAA domain-containing protein n=1 Tax=Paraburkholderia lycopersici TaxID=416944 RepID=A0A1G6MN28_9BURK|nr:AAA domain-containing protein [Paraburkholderia lycopersici]